MPRTSQKNNEIEWNKINQTLQNKTTPSKAKQIKRKETPQRKQMNEQTNERTDKRHNIQLNI